MIERNFREVFLDVAGPTAKIVSEAKEIEEGNIKRITYTYTVYDADAEVTTGPFKLSVFTMNNSIGFLLE